MKKLLPILFLLFLVLEASPSPMIAVRVNETNYTHFIPTNLFNANGIYGTNYIAEMITNLSPATLYIAAGTNIVVLTNGFLRTIHGTATGGGGSTTYVAAGTNVTVVTNGAVFTVSADSPSTRVIAGTNVTVVTNGANYTVSASPSTFVAAGTNITVITNGSLYTVNSEALDTNLYSTVDYATNAVNLGASNRIYIAVVGGLTVATSAIPALYSTKFTITSPIGLYGGSGDPEGVVTASPGSIYSDYTGGAGSSFYIKESGSGNTGWVAAQTYGSLLASDNIWTGSNYFNVLNVVTQNVTTLNATNFNLISTNDHDAVFLVDGFAWINTNQVGELTVTQGLTLGGTRITSWIDAGASASDVTNISEYIHTNDNYTIRPTNIIMTAAAGSGTMIVDGYITSQTNLVNEGIYTNALWLAGERVTAWSQVGIPAATVTNVAAYQAQIATNTLAGTITNAVSTTNLYVLGTGSVGIRTNAPATALHVNGGVLVEGSQTNVGSVNLLGNAGTGALNVDGYVKSINLTNTGVLQASNVIIYPSNYATIPLRVYNNANAASLVVNSNGNVGIGYINPLLPLTIQNSSPIIKFTDGASSLFWIHGKAGNVSQTFGIYDETAAKYRIIINNSGFVGIGTNTPKWDLSVKNVVANDDVAVEVGNDAKSWLFEILGSDGSDDLRLYNDTDSRLGLGIAAADGVVYVPNGLHSTNSIGTTVLGIGAAIGSQTTNSLIAGKYSGYQALLAYDIVGFGPYAAYQANNIYQSCFVGSSSGYQSSDNYQSDFSGYYSGASSGNNNKSRFAGFYSGAQATNCYSSVYDGYGSGYQANGTYASVAIGYYAGSASKDAYNSIFIGSLAGTNTVRPYTLLIGTTGKGTNALVYGEFDTPMLRVNGALEVTNTAKVTSTLTALTNLAVGGTATLTNGFSLLESANQRAGVVTLANGSNWVANTSVTAKTRFALTYYSIDFSLASIGVCNAAAGGGFAILSSNATDTNQVHYLLWEAP